MTAPPKSLFPAGVRTAFANGGESIPPPPLPEALAVRNAVASRQREFAIGRWCARRALAQLGVSAAVIPVAPNRAPLWPDGIVGSITHCREFAGAAVASDHDLRSIGFDAERSDPLDPDLVKLVCTVSEMAWVATQPPTGGIDWAKIIFSSKEAVHKCISPVSGLMLDFLDVELRIDPSSMSFQPRPATADAVAANLTVVSGRIALTEQFVFTCAFVAQ